MSDDKARIMRDFIRFHMKVRSIPLRTMIITNGKLRYYATSGITVGIKMEINEGIDLDCLMGECDC